MVSVKRTIGLLPLLLVGVAYLAHNPAPQVAFFELTAIHSHESAVKYMHPAFAIWFESLIDKAKTH